MVCVTQLGGACFRRYQRSLDTRGPSSSSSTTGSAEAVAYRFSALLALLALALSAFSVSALAEQDAGASYTLLLKGGIGGKWFLISRSNLSTRNNFGDPFLGYTGIGLGYQLTPAFSVRAGYRRAWFRFTDTWQPEDRGYLEAYFAGKALTGVLERRDT
jgi:hypothetical protein